MERAIKQSLRGLARWCHNTAQDQHSKANSSCCVFSIESRANAGAGERSDFANPSKTHRLADRSIKFAPRELAQGGALQIPSRPPVAVPGSGGSAAGQAPCTPRAAVTATAHNHLVHPIRRARIPAQISPFRQLSQNWHP